MKYKRLKRRLLNFIVEMSKFFSKKVQDRVFEWYWERTNQPVSVKRINVEKQFFITSNLKNWWKVWLYAAPSRDTSVHRVFYTLAIFCFRWNWERRDVFEGEI